MTEDLFTRKQIENAVMLAADLYQGMYNSPAFAMRAPKNLRPQCKALGSDASLVEVIGSAASLVEEL